MTLRFYLKYLEMLPYSQKTIRALHTHSMTHVAYIPKRKQ